EPPQIRIIVQVVAVDKALSDNCFSPSGQEIIDIVLMSFRIWFPNARCGRHRDGLRSVSSAPMDGSRETSFRVAHVQCARLESAQSQLLEKLPKRTRILSVVVMARLLGHTDVKSVDPASMTDDVITVFYDREKLRRGPWGVAPIRFAPNVTVHRLPSGHGGA